MLLSLCLLTFTLSFQCTTKEGLAVPCNLCGAPNPATGAVYDCNAYHDALSAALSGYANSTVWLVFAAFQLGRAVQVTEPRSMVPRRQRQSAHGSARPTGAACAHKVTGLGKRLSLRLVQLLGRNMVGLGYAVCVSGACASRPSMAQRRPRLTWSATA